MHWFRAGKSQENAFKTVLNDADVYDIGGNTRPRRTSGD